MKLLEEREQLPDGPAFRELTWDELAVLKTFARALENEGDVTTCADAREALSAIASGQPFDVIFCDLMMPNMNGIEFFAELGKVAPDLCKRVVFLTGGAFTQAATDFLVGKVCFDKPVAIDLRRGLVREAPTA